ncbi:MAG: hypothetical protein ACKV2Q_31320 [Planctomycetaceae bacterium]
MSGELIAMRASGVDLDPGKLKSGTTVDSAQLSVNDFGGCV